MFFQFLFSLKSNYCIINLHEFFNNIILKTKNGEIMPKIVIDLSFILMKK